MLGEILDKIEEKDEVDWSQSITGRRKIVTHTKRAMMTIEASLPAGFPLYYEVEIEDTTNSGAGWDNNCRMYIRFRWFSQEFERIDDIFRSAWEEISSIKGSPPELLAEDIEEGRLG